MDLSGNRFAGYAALAVLAAGLIAIPALDLPAFYVAFLFVLYYFTKRTRRAFHSVVRNTTPLSKAHA